MLMSPKARDKIQKSTFVYRTLDCQHASVKHGETPVHFSFQRERGLDGSAHEYSVRKELKDRKFEFILTQDGNKVEFPRPVYFLEDVVAWLVERYEARGVTPPSGDSDWESVFATLRDHDKQNQVSIEHYASYVQLLQECCLNTSVDVQAMAKRYFDEIGEKLDDHFIDRYIKNDTRINKMESKNIDDPLKRGKLTWYFLDPDREKEATSMDEAIKGLFRVRMNELFFGQYLPRIPAVASHPQAVLDEYMLLMNVKRVNESLRLPATLFPFKIALDDEKQQKQLPDEGMKFFKTQITHYLDSKADSKHDEASAAGNLTGQSWLVEAPIATGKSTLASAVFKHLSAEYQRTGWGNVPLLVRASEIRGKDFSHFLGDVFKENVGLVNVIRQGCRAGKRRMVCIVDGLDECTDPSIRRRVIDQCKGLQADGVFLILTTRPDELTRRQASEALSGLRVIRLGCSDIFLKDPLIPQHLKNAPDLVDAMFPSGDFPLPIKTPLLQAEIDKLFIPDKDGRFPYASLYPVSMNKLIQIYYEVTLDHSKMVGRLPGSKALAEIIEAGMAVAIDLLDEKQTTKTSPDRDLLVKAGLLEKTTSSVRFIHDLFLIDMAARAITTREPRLPDARVFNMIKRKPDIGMFAVRMALEKGTVDDTRFDLFEHLYDDNVGMFSRLKALVWKARGKGPTPLMETAFREYMAWPDAQEIYSNVDWLSILDTIGVSCDSFELAMLERKDFDFFKHIPVSSKNVAPYLAILAAHENRALSSSDFGEIRSWFHGVLGMADPITFLIEECPPILLRITELALVEIMHPGKSKVFFQQYFQKIFNERDDDVVKSYIINTIYYPPAFPDFSRLPRDFHGRAASIAHTIISQWGKPIPESNMFLELFRLGLHATEDFVFYDTLKVLAGLGASHLNGLLAKNEETFNEILSRAFSINGWLVQWFRPFVRSLDQAHLHRTIDAIDDPGFLFLMLDMLHEKNNSDDDMLRPLSDKLKNMLKNDQSTQEAYDTFLSRGMIDQAVGFLEPLSGIIQQYLIPRNNPYPVWPSVTEVEQILLHSIDEKRELYHLRLTMAVKNHLIRKMCKSGDFSPTDRFSNLFEIDKERSHSVYWFIRAYFRSNDAFKPFMTGLMEQDEPWTHLKMVLEGDTISKAFDEACWTSFLSFLRSPESERGKAVWLVEGMKGKMFPQDVREKIAASTESIETFLKQPIPLDHHHTWSEFYKGLISDHPGVGKKVLEWLLDYDPTRTRFPSNISCFLEYYEYFRPIFKNNFHYLTKNSFPPGYLTKISFPPGIFKNDDFLEDCIESGEIDNISTVHQHTVETFFEKHKEDPRYSYYQPLFNQQKPIAWLAELSKEQERCKASLARAGVDVSDEFDD